MRSHRLPTRLLLALAVGALFGLPSSTSAQIQPGRVYQAGEIISEPSAGLSLTIPGGWRGALAPDGSMFMLEPVVGTGVMFVIADQIGEPEARAEMSKPLDLRNGIILTPAGEIREISSGHLSRPFVVQGAPMDMQGTVEVRLTSNGLGVAFILLSPPAQADPQLDAMRTFALSLGVTEPAQPAAAVHAGAVRGPLLHDQRLHRVDRALAVQRRHLLLQRSVGWLRWGRVGSVPRARRRALVGDRRRSHGHADPRLVERRAEHPVSRIRLRAG